MAQPQPPMQEVPYGYCHCGCGRKTQIADRNRKNRGNVKGEPVRFIRGHAVAKSRVFYIVHPETGCWEWQRATDGRGYGLAWGNKGRQERAHRVYYERHVGPIPEGLQIDHLCRNRGCVNPHHLEPVTAQENCRRASRTKLSIDAAREIRTRLDLSTRFFADKYDVTPHHIRMVRAGVGWQEAV